MPFPFVPALVVAGLGAASVLLRWDARRRDARFTEVWGRGKGGRAALAQDEPARGVVVAELVVGSVRVRAARGSGRGLGLAFYDRALFAAAPYALGAGPTFEVWPADVLDLAARDDRLVVAPGFDYSHVTVGRDPNAVRRVLTAERASRFLERVYRVEMRSDENELVVWTRASNLDERDARGLDALVELTAEMVSRGVPELASLTRRCGGVLVPAGETAPHGRLEVDGARARIDARWSSAGTLDFTVSGAVDPALPRFSARLGVEGELVGGIPPGLVGPEEAALIHAAGRVTLVADRREATVAFFATPEPAQVLAAARLVGRLGKRRPAQGVFR